MSVIKAKRNESSTDFYINLQKMETEIIHFMLKDFNIKHCNKDLKLFSYKAKLNEEETKFLNKLIQTHQDINIEVAYPLWLLEYFRSAILDDLRYIKVNVIEGYTIFPGTEYEFNIKKGHIWAAISGCYKLLSDIKQAIEQFHPVSKEKYMPTVDLVDKEISFLKTWKKTTNSQYKHIKKANVKQEEQKALKKNKKKIEKEKVESKIVTPIHIDPFHFVPVELTINVSFDSFVEKEIVTTIHFVPIN